MSGMLVTIVSEWLVRCRNVCGGYKAWIGKWRGAFTPPTSRRKMMPWLYCQAKLMRLPQPVVHYSSMEGNCLSNLIFIIDLESDLLDSGRRSFVPTQLTPLSHNMQISIHCILLNSLPISFQNSRTPSLSCDSITAAIVSHSSDLLSWHSIL